MKLLSQTVKIANTDLINFFYPEYVKRDQVTMLEADKKIIYVGRMRPDLLHSLQLTTKGFINTVGPTTLDLSTNDLLLKFAYDRHGKHIPKYVVEQSASLDDDTFLNNIKVVWLTGAWPVVHKEDEVSLYDLFSSTTKSTKECLQTYLALRELYPFPVIEASFLTFLSRTKDIEEQQVKPGYKRLLIQFKTQSGHKLKPALLEYATKQGVNQELAFVSLLLGLRP